LIVITRLRKVVSSQVSRLWYDFSYLYSNVKNVFQPLIHTPPVARFHSQQGSLLMLYRH